MPDDDDFPHVKGEDVLIEYLVKSVNRAMAEWNLTAPQIMGVFELSKLRFWAQFDEVPSGTREEDDEDI